MVSTQNKIHSVEVNQPSYFYSEIKSIGMISLVLGLFPFENAKISLSGKMLKYRMLSLINIYSVIYHVFITLIVIILLQFCKKFLSIINVYYLIFKFWIIFLSTQISNSSLPTFIHRVEQLDAYFNKCNIKYNYKKSKSFYFAISVCFIMYSISILFQIFYEDEDHHYLLHQTHLFFTTVLKLDFIFISLLYIYLCNGLLTRIEVLNSIIINTTSLPNNEICSKLDKIQFLQSKIHSLSNCLNSCFSIRITAVFAFAYTEILLISYKDIIARYDTNIVNIFQIVYLSIFIHYITYYSQKIQTNNQKILIYLRDVSLKEMPIQQLLKIKEIMKQTMAGSAIMSAAGYFEVTNETLASRMVEYIEQDSLEKVEEIDIKTEEEFIIEKNKCRDKEIVKIAAYYDNLEKKLAREFDADICRLAHQFRMDYLRAEDAVIEDVRKKARYRLKNIDCEGNVDAYRKILSALILQALLKLLDDEIRIMVREKDKTIIDDCIKTAVDAYKEVTKRNVESIVDTTYLPPDCFGGVVVSSRKGNVSVDNTLECRLQIISESPYSPLLPVYRLMLFGVNPSRKHFD